MFCILWSVSLIYAGEEWVISSFKTLLVAMQGPNQWLEVMRKKRAVHEAVINLVHEKQSSNQVAQVLYSFLLFVKVMHISFENVKRVFIHWLVIQSNVARNTYYLDIPLRNISTQIQVCCINRQMQTLIHANLVKSLLKPVDLWALILTSEKV